MKFFEDRQSIMAPLRGGFDITVAETDLAQVPRVVMVSTDGATITGILIDQDTSHTTLALKAGVMYPLQFKRITAISTGTAKGYY